MPRGPGPLSKEAISGGNGWQRQRICTWRWAGAESGSVEFLPEPASPVHLPTSRRESARVRQGQCYHMVGMVTGGRTRAALAFMTSERNPSGQRLLTISAIGPQGHPCLGSPQDPPARYRPDPPRRSFPWQARRPPQDPRPGCPPGHRSLQDQRRSPPQSQLPLRHRHVAEDRPERP